MKAELTERGYPARNFKTGTFLKGHIPHNKGRKWEEWMDMRKARKVLRIGMKNLSPGRDDIGGWNRKKVVAVREEDGQHWVFSSATKAAELTGLERRNISACCEKKRKHCGPFRWFFFDDDEWTNLIRR